MSNVFRDGPPIPGGNTMVSGPARERLRIEFEAAREQRLLARSAEQKQNAKDFYAAKRLREKAAAEGTTP